MEDKYLRLIESYNNIVIFGHVNPDGDCFSSQVALKRALNINYPFKKVFIVGSGIPSMSDFLSKCDEIDDDVISNSLAIALDFNDINRSEDKRILNAKEILFIDHHNPFEDVLKKFNYAIIDKNFASAATLLYFLFKKWNLKMDVKTYEILFFGIVSDTNRFLFLEDDFKNLKACYEMMNLGINYAKVYDFTQKTTLTNLNLKGYVLSHYHIFKSKILYAIIDDAILKKYNYHRYPGWLVSCLGNVNNYPIWCLFYIKDDNKISIEIRSSSIKVVDVAKKYGGGGHDLACGMTIDYSKENIKRVLNDLQLLLKEN